MKTLTKALVGTVAAGAMAMGSTAAQAQSRYDNYRDRDRGGVDVGDVIAGALIIGGIAAVASSVGRGRGYDDGYVYEGGRGDRGYNRGYNDQNPRQAVEQCVNAAERNASRYSYRGDAQVTDIRSIDRKRDGYVIKGRIAVNTRGRDWNRRDDRYGRGWDNDYRGWNDNYRGYDAGRFSCRIQYGRVVDIDYGGIRGL